MANEATVRCSLNIRKGHLNYESRPSEFRATVSGTKGPSPAAITITQTGTDVDLSQLEDPGLCRLMNLDTINYVEYGIWDPETERFYPLGEILPGEFYVLRLSRMVGFEVATGTGTADAGGGTNRLRIRANVASCIVSVEAFER